MPLLTRAYRLLQFLMVLCIALMALMIFANVILRYAFNSGLNISEELSRYLFVWLTFLGTIAAFIKGTHIRVDTFFRAMPPALQRPVAIGSNLAMLGCCVMLFIGCWRLAMSNMHNLLPISGIPVGVLYFAGVPSSLVISLILLCQIKKLLFPDARGGSQ